MCDEQTVRGLGAARIFLWQFSIEYHQYYTWLSVHALLGGGITFVLQEAENDLRKAQGWRAVDLSKLHVLFLHPSKLWLEGARLIRDNRDAIHVFLSFKGTKRGYGYLVLILYSIILGAKVAVINEPYSLNPIGYFHDENPLWSRVKVWTRPILYRAMALSMRILTRNQQPCIFPVSLIAQEQFKKAGFPPESLYPFGWFVPRTNAVSVNRLNTGVRRFVYVGVLIRRKGLDVLVKAMRLLRAEGYDVTLDIYGMGDTSEYDLPQDAIRCRGTLPFEAVQTTIRSYDALVMPSRHDGWGVVVNEALLQGVPVIASDRVGAKCLLESSKAGLVFESENIQDLADKMRTFLDDVEMTHELRANALSVGDRILPETAARYFVNSLACHFYKTDRRSGAPWSDILLEG